jgi:hypothetical protein
MLYNGIMNNTRTHKGQILLITLLVLSIATTIALSLIARTTTDLNISNEADESSRAFNAAEAGIEQALLSNTAPAGTQTLLGNDATYAVTQNQIGGETGTYKFPRVTSVGQTETLWLVPHETDPLDPNIGEPIVSTKGYTADTMKVCFAANSALEVVIYYLRGGEYRIARGLYDSESGRVGTNNFTQADGSGCGADTNTSYSHSIDFPTDFSINPGVAESDTLVFMRFRPLYANTQIAVNASAAIPLQGNTFESCGTTGTGIRRCISVIQNYRTPSGLFDYVIYSNTGSFAPVGP